MLFERFISFEGIDFSGKSTQIELLMQKLSGENIRPHLVREPGGTAISEKIRDILLDKSHSEMHPRTEILLYSAARSQLVHQRILPLLEEGQYVIADRFFDSTTAYQGYGRNLDIELVQMLNTFATSGLKPYRTFFLDISPEEAERRRKKQKRERDRLESEGISFYQKIRRGFLEMAQQEPQRFIIINGERPIPEISDEIWKHVRELWSLR